MFTARRLFSLTCTLALLLALCPSVVRAYPPRIRKSHRGARSQAPNSVPISNPDTHSSTDNGPFEKESSLSNERFGRLASLQRILPATVSPVPKQGDQTVAPLSTAFFSMGCFWGAEAAFGCLACVHETTVGYAGGTTPSPTYEAVGDHAETVRVRYDPHVCSYADLVSVFLRAHERPTGGIVVPDSPARSQYRSILFYDGASQHMTAVESLGNAATADSFFLSTVLMQASVANFSPAERYHHKYSLQQQLSSLPLHSRIPFDLNSAPATWVNSLLASDILGSNTASSLSENPGRCRKHEAEAVLAALASQSPSEFDEPELLALLQTHVKDLPEDTNIRLASGSPNAQPQPVLELYQFDLLVILIVGMVISMVAWLRRHSQ